MLGQVIQHAGKIKDRHWCGSANLLKGEGQFRTLVRNQLRKTKLDSRAVGHEK
jgi:hypothetical protein